jgi:hypothetical protein
VGVGVRGRRVAMATITVISTRTTTIMILIRTKIIAMILI